MNTNFTKELSKDLKLEIKNVLNEMIKVRKNNYVHEYKNLTDSLRTLIEMENRYSNNDISKYNFYACVQKDIENEVNELKKFCKQHLTDNNYTNYRNNLISMERLAKLHHDIERIAVIKHELKTI